MRPLSLTVPAIVGAACATLLATSPVAAAPLVAGFGSSSLPANDDGSAGPVALPFSVNYFGTTYTNLFVNNNGNLTFGAGMSTYTPSGLGAGYTGLPIIAAFFADVDTRGTGSALTTYGTGTYDGRTAFGATWDGVGYYSGQTDKLNKFQVILTDRSDTGAGNFDIWLNYAQILWETGSASGGSGGFGGTPAAAGYNAGSGNAAGTYYMMPGSLTSRALIDGGPNSLVAGSNTGTAGLYLFTVRNGQVIVNPGPVPEPATWAMMIAGFGMIGAGMRRRRTQVRFAV